MLREQSTGIAQVPGFGRLVRSIYAGVKIIFQSRNLPSLSHSSTWSS